MDGLEKGAFLIRIFGVLASLALLVYGAGSVSLGLSKPGVSADRFCAAWLCPEEFSDQRLAELLREPSGGEGQKAILELKRALVFDSASAYRWANLGESLFNAGDQGSAKYCFQRAVAAGPRNPAILFRAANFYFSIGDERSSIRDLSTILRDPELTEYYTPVFLTYSRMAEPIGSILAVGIPPTRVAAQTFLRFWIDSKQLDDAESTWKWISERNLGDDQLTADYIGFLLRSKQNEAAAQTWAGLNASNMPDYYRTNWVFNGSFEKAPKPCPLDWHITPSDDVNATRVTGEAHDGGWSLKLTFGGKNNVDYYGAEEQAVLTPGRWRVQAFIKTDRITTDKGVSLRLYDPAQPQNLDVKTDGLTGTHDWTQIAETFAISKTIAVELQITRPASLHFDNKIAGTAWIDSVAINPIR